MSVGETREKSKNRDLQSYDKVEFPNVHICPTAE